MNILVTGANGFVGKNLCQALKNVRNGKDNTRGIAIDEIYEFDRNTPKEYQYHKCRKKYKNKCYRFHRRI